MSSDDVETDVQCPRCERCPECGGKSGPLEPEVECPVCNACPVCHGHRLVPTWIRIMWLMKHGGPS